MIFVALWISAALFPKELGEAADALNTSGYIPEPAWYFMGVYQMLKYFPGYLDVFAMIILPGIFFAGFFALPWIDRNPSNSVRKRPFALGSAAIIVVGMIFLTFEGLNSVPKPLVDTGVVEHPSYAKDIRPILQNKCVQCHDGIASFPQTMKRVTAGKPENSLLVTRINGSKGPVMPLGKQPLSENQVQTITNWVKDGAKDN